MTSTDAPSRVALFPSQYAPHLGGVEELSAKLAAAIIAAGSTASVITHRWPSTLAARERIDGVEVSRVAFPMPTGSIGGVLRWLLAAPRSLATCVRHLRRSGASVVHVQCVSANALYAWLAARIVRVPLVVTLQGELTMDATGVYSQSFVLRRLLRHLLAHADAVTACSAQTLREAEQMMGVVTGRRGAVIYNGVDIAEFADDSPTPGTPHGRYVLGIGRLVAEKGFDVLLEAFAGITDGDVRLVIAGAGPQDAALREAADRLGIAARVDFVGRTDRPATVELFRNCTVFVLASRHEPFGIVNIEAMAAGAPIVATSVGGVPEFVEHRRNGLLVEAGDATAMRQAIVELLNDRSLSERLAAAGHGDVSRFEWSSIAGEYESIYRAVRSARRSRRRRRSRG
jgi:glycogen synthase